MNYEEKERKILEPFLKDFIMLLAANDYNELASKLTLLKRIVDVFNNLIIHEMKKKKSKDETKHFGKQQEILSRIMLAIKDYERTNNVDMFHIISEELQRFLRALKV